MKLAATEVLKPELGNSLLDRPEPLVSNDVIRYVAVMKDADLRSYYTEHFVARSGSELYLWSVEARTLGRRLGHCQLEIYKFTGTQAQYHAKNLLVSWARLEQGDWIDASLFQEIESV